MNFFLKILFVTLAVFLLFGGWQWLRMLAIRKGCSEHNCGDSNTHPSCLGCGTKRK